MACIRLRGSAHFGTPLAGERVGLSFALRVDATPAYVVDPNRVAVVSDVKSYKAELSAKPAASR